MLVPCQDGPPVGAALQKKNAARLNEAQAAASSPGREIVNPDTGVLIAFQKWSTRNIPKDPSHSLTRRALMTLLESDAVCNYVTNTEKDT